VTTSDRYRAFSEVEAAGSSPSYEALALAVSNDTAVLKLLSTLEPAKQQPNLLFAACQFLGATFDIADETLTFIIERWNDVAMVMREHSTQTNEAARAATFLPILASLPQPLSLIEVGASAGLCLYPDRYRIQYGDADPVGPIDSSVSFEVVVRGAVPIPSKELTISWRAGVDLNPLDASKSEDLAWLSACIWPEHEERRKRLFAAASIAQKDPPEMRRGDLVESIDDILHSVPSDSTPVVFHSAVLGYLDEARRIEFSRRMRDHTSATWISNEGPGVISGLESDARVPDGFGPRNYFVVGLMGERSVGKSDPHGRWLSWDD
jgi:hypothetical protein